MKNLYIGVDSGGTNCRVGLGDGTGRIIHASNYDSLHYSETGAKAFAERISAVFDEFCAEINLELKSVAGICVGAAGARHENDKSGIRDALATRINFHNIKVVSDSAVAYCSAFNDGDGLILISGTGSALFGKYKGRDVRIGGWGKILGDEGSSHSISLNMLRRFAVKADESGPEGELEKSLKEEFGITRENLIEKIYHGNFTIHTLSPLVIRLAENGEKICSDTVRDEIDGLIRLLRAYLKRYSPAETTELALLGSVLENDNFFSREFKNKSGEVFGNLFSLKEERINTLKGALKIAVKTFAE
ncbi:MAG: hypothetical protein LWX07_02955 [Bacteroidetes bacterium]|nr:hypothetical protein [Bacteroidota bacterium]